MAVYKGRLLTTAEMATLDMSLPIKCDILDNDNRSSDCDFDHRRVSPTHELGQYKSVGLPIPNEEGFFY